MQGMRIPLRAGERKRLYGGRAARLRRSAIKAADHVFGGRLPAVRLSNNAFRSRAADRPSGRCGAGRAGNGGGDTMNAALLSSKKMDWCTPQDFFDKLNEEFRFVLDAAATEKTKKCDLCYTPETDGLSQSWDRGGAVFCNPPYGREIGKWVQKAYSEAMRGGMRSFFLFPLERIQAIFTISFTGKRKSASYAGGFASQTTTETRAIPRPSLQCLLSITGRGRRNERRSKSRSGTVQEQQSEDPRVSMQDMRQFRR